MAPWARPDLSRDGLRAGCWGGTEAGGLGNGLMRLKADFQSGAPDRGFVTLSPTTRACSAWLGGEKPRKGQEPEPNSSCHLETMSEREKEAQVLLNSAQALGWGRAVPPTGVGGERGRGWPSASPRTPLQNVTQSFTYGCPPETDTSHTDRQNRNHPRHTCKHMHPSKYTKGCTLVHNPLSLIPNSKKV